MLYTTTIGIRKQKTQTRGETKWIEMCLFKRPRISVLIGQRLSPHHSWFALTDSGHTARTMSAAFTANAGLVHRILAT